MSALSQRIGQPLYAYISPLEPGPYRSRYPYVFTGHVAYGDIGSVGMGDLFYTDEFWDDQVRKCRDWGCEGLMHDFLSNYWNTPAAVDVIDRYMKSMAKACQKYGLSIQYCMCFSNHVLETVENPAVISLQAIADHHPSASDGGCGSNLRSFIYSSLLYGALGLWPARDNIQTMNDADAYEDVLVANLSGGPIQLGHEIGKADLGLLRQTFREGDGLLLKPDRPLCPIDACFIDDHNLIACTQSRHPSGTWHYVLSLNIGNDQWQGGSFSPDDCGCDQDEYVLYNYRTGEISPIGRKEIYHCPDHVKSSYYVLAPLLGCPGTLIGDISKFVTMADQRICAIETDRYHLTFSLLAGGA
ncbi:MAG TPA: hypothetical protein DF409_16535, partial [Bacteroidales bacterium]|nr:hypothetical protein [Bacteroidales bacterium]